MRGEVTFTMKEMTRYSVIQSLLERKMVNREAAQAIGLSLRQVQRIKRKVESLGPEGVLHGNKGRSPSHCHRDCNNVPEMGSKSVPPLKN